MVSLKDSILSYTNYIQCTLAFYAFSNIANVLQFPFVTLYESLTLSIVIFLQKNYLCMSHNSTLNQITNWPIILYSLNHRKNKAHILFGTDKIALLTSTSLCISFLCIKFCTNLVSQFPQFTKFVPFNDPIEWKI